MTPSEPSYSEIPLTKGQVAFVDPDDYERIAVHSWYAFWNKGTQTYYAARNEWLIGQGRHRTIYMHREILGLTFGDKRQGEHVEPSNTLDNRRSNIRIATRQQNMWNTRNRANNTSGFKGVHKFRDGWRFTLRIDGKRIQSAGYRSPEEAYQKRCELAAIYHGEFARNR